MKKVLTALFTLLLVLTLSGETEARSPRIWVNGRYIESDAQPFIYNNRTMLPVRSVSNALGFRVIWRPEDRAVMIGDYDQVANGNCVALYIGDHTIYLGEDEENSIYSDVAPLIRNGRAYLPLRALAQALGEPVQWDRRNFTVAVGRGYPSLVSTCSYPRATVTRIVNGTTLDIRYDNGRTRRVKLHAFRPRTPDSDRGYLSNLDVHRMLLLNQQVYVVETKTGNDEVFIFMHRPIHNRPTEDEVKRLCYNYFAPRILSD